MTFSAGTGLQPGEREDPLRAGRRDHLHHDIIHQGRTPSYETSLRQIDRLCGMLGILKAGGAYVPLDADHPADRLAFLLEDTGASIIVTQSALRGSLPPTGATVVCLDTDWETISACPAEEFTTPGSAEDLVYVIYTSGSTGRPKGVMISHRGLMNYLVWAVDGYGLQGASGAPMLGSIAFDLSVPNFFLPLLGGKDVTMLPPDPTLAGLAEVLARPGDFSLLKITPGHLDVLRGHLRPDMVHSVRTFVVGADEMRPETAAGWQRIAPGARIINEYGPTETVVGCSVYEMPAADRFTGPVPIGHPIANTTMYVLDERLRPVPIGVTGELYIGGEGVARGYLNRSGLTAQRFLPDPFARTPGARFYRTGDLARWRADGELEFLGRIDHQVKIRGYRIELGEIEAQLTACPGVSEAVVAARQDDRGDKSLCAYVVADPGVRLRAADLRHALLAALPPYMVPSSYTVLDALPLSQGGKVHRRLLPAPSGERQVATAYRAPGSPVEETLAEIWRQVLHLDCVGVDDNFFRVGGDSLKAITTVDRIRTMLGIEVPLAVLFQHPTIAELALAVRDLACTNGNSSPLVLRRGDDSRPPLVLFPAQGGQAAAYLNLVRLLDDAQPVYAFQSVGIDSAAPAPSNMDDIVAHALNALRGRQPAGPYRVAGWSFGGLVAFEAARQLELAGYRVEFLGLFDTPLFDAANPPDWFAEYREKSAVVKLAIASDIDDRQLEGCDEDQILEVILSERRARNQVSSLAGSEMLRRLAAVYQANEVATLDYHIRSAVHADIHLFRAARRGRWLINDVTPEDWQPYTQGSVHTYELPGDHEELMEMPNVTELATALTGVLRTLDGG
ncbi:MULTISPECIES: non-ribosomal peptide synthetase [unclassified Micromonospora]|uniref:non-ribosomal peptide synthetase n=1 Tax=unclassified Micromonospora TaxID=2617518 RepID=UPI003A864C72